MTLCPTTDLAEFMGLPDDVRREVQRWVTQLERVTVPVGRSIKRVAKSMGVSVATARRKYDLWRARKDWRALVNRTKVPEARGVIAPEFVEYWKGLCERNGRKCKAAHRQFLREFASGAVIPGLPPGMLRGDYEPSGYSYDNLMRYAPTQFELTAARVGRGAAADFRPKLFTTRVGLRVGERYIFDDMWHDFKVVMIHQRRPMRLLQLHAHDLFSGCQFARGLKPRMEDEATGKSVNLRESEMHFLLANVLGEFGYCATGCTLMVEHGTAAIDEGLEKLLFDLTQGLVRVERSGIQGASAFAGQYPGRGKGNFRFKAALESLGNLIHNETANMLAFPGQTGSNSRTNLPEELAGRERRADTLALAMRALPGAVAEKLRLPFLEVTQARWAVEEVMERINQRTDHELEGWLEAGLTTTDLLLPGVGLIPSAKLLEFPVEKRAAIEGIAELVTRKLSPREVFNAGRTGLVKFRPEQTAALLHATQGREVSVGKDHLIAFEDQNISPSPLRYLAHHFAPGDKFQAVVNPWAPQSLHLFDARGGWRGTVSAWQTVQANDSEALHRAMGAAAKAEAELLTPLAARGRVLTRERLEQVRENVGVLAGSTAQAAADDAEIDDALRMS